MSRKVFARQSRVHLPLRSVALCLDCEVCFELGPEECPACGSETWTPLARFLGGPVHRLGAVLPLAS
jgi:hypothetical protein